MSGEDLGAEWGAAPEGDDLGADWGGSAPVFRRGAPQTSKSGKTGRVDTTTYAREAIPSATQQVASVQPSPTWQETISPKTVAAQRSGVGWPGQALSIGEDALTLPLGIFAGIGNAVGEFAKSRDLGETGKAYLQGVATRGGVAMDNAEEAGIGPGFVRGLIRGGSAPAGSPLTVLGLALGGISPGAGTGLMAALRQAAVSPFGGGIALGGANAGIRKAEYLTGLGSDPTTVSAEDFIPVAMGAGMAGVGKVASAGPRVRQYAADLIRRAGKPTTDPEVLAAGNDFLVGQGQLPNVTKGAWLPEGIARNFNAAKRPIVKNVGRQAREADEAGAMVNLDRAVAKAERSVKGQQDAMDIVLSDPELARSIDWMKSRALVPDAAMRAKLDAANIPHEGRFVPLIGKEQQWSPLRSQGTPVDETVTMGSTPRIVERHPLMDEKGVQVFGPNLDPQFYQQEIPANAGKNIRMQGYFPEGIPPISQMSPAEILQNAPQMRPFIKEGQFPSGDRDVVSGYQKLPDYLQPIPDIETTVSKAWNLQRRMQKMSLKNEPSETTPQAGRMAAAKSLDQALREQFGEIAPSLIHAKDAASPYLAAEPYFTSLERRANNYHATPWELWRAAHIKGAQGAWKGSALLDAVAKSGKLPSYAPIGIGEKEKR